MHCKDYDPIFHIRLTVFIGQDEKAKSSPSLLEYHIHAKNCELHRLDYANTLANYKMDENEKRYFRSGLARVEESLVGIIV